MTQFCDNHPLLVFLFMLWLSGAIIHFISTIGQMFWRLLRSNSLRNRNLWLIGLETQWVTGMLREKEPGELSWKEQFQLVGFGIFFMVLNSAISWIGVLATAAVTLFGVYKSIFTPSRIKEISWRAGNIEYRCAEDYLELMHESYLANGKGASWHDLEDAANSVSAITARYAEKVFVGDPEGVDWYISQAQALSEKRFHSKVIHPSFWMIPFTREAAEQAAGCKKGNRSVATDSEHNVA